MIGKEMFCDYILLTLFDSFFCCEYSSINIFDYIKKSIVILYQIIDSESNNFAVYVILKFLTEDLNQMYPIGNKMVVYD